MFEGLTLRFKLIKAIIIDTFYNETTYWSNGLANAFSTTFYNLAYIVFINVLFANTKLIAGYSYNEVMLFYFVNELLVYTFGLVLPSLDNFAKAINQGELDLVFTKPIPHLFYMSFRKINIIVFVRDCIVPLTILAFLIKWSEFNFTLENLVYGSIIFILGLICTYCVVLISVLPAFWLGESRSILGFVNEFWFSSGSIIPYEGFKQVFKQFTVFFLPSLLPAAISTSVLLNRSEPVPFVVIGILITISFLVLRLVLWHLAIRNYTSASS